MSRLSPITNNLFTIDNLILSNTGIVYNFTIRNKYIEIKHFLSNFVIGCVEFKDEFFMWDELSEWLNNHLIK